MGFFVSTRHGNIQREINPTVVLNYRRIGGRIFHYDGPRRMLGSQNCGLSGITGSSISPTGIGLRSVTAVPTLHDLTNAALI